MQWSYMCSVAKKTIFMKGLATGICVHVIIILSLYLCYSMSKWPVIADLLPSS